MEIKNRYTRQVIFSDESGTIKEALLNAIKEGANLSEADLSWVDLSGADLSGTNLSWVNLSEANLSRVNLSGADLSRVNLSGADLSEANLSRVYLSETNLTGADLSGTNLSGAVLPIYCKWYVTIKDNTINIGCKNKTIPEWEDWFNNSTEEFSTKRDTEDFKRIKAMFYAYKTYYEIINNY